MVDTCITSAVKNKPAAENLVRFMDGRKSLLQPERLTVAQSVYLNTQNSVIFKPSELNMRIYELYGEKVKALYDKWWDKIKTSREIEKNKRELEEYRASLKPGDVALLGCLTEGGQGLATANNGKYIAVRSTTKWAENIRVSRPKKLADFLARTPKAITAEMRRYPSYVAFLQSLSEAEIAELFDSLKEQYGRDIFGQGYLYKIVDDCEIADVDSLTNDEKENGIETTKPYYVPYDKGDKDGNRWYLETPFAIAWSKENVRFLKTDPKARYQGYTFYFREGFPDIQEKGIFEDGDIRNSEYNIKRNWYYNNPLTPNKLGQKCPIDDKSWSQAQLFPALKKFFFGKEENLQLTGAYKDRMKFRLAETYLLLAEAYLRQDMPDKAADAVNEVRRRAKVSDVSDEEMTMDFLLDERIRELYGEESRRFTLIRTGKLLERVRKYNPEARDLIQDFHVLWPIPQAIRDANVGNFPQNPGYEGYEG